MNRKEQLLKREEVKSVIPEIYSFIQRNSLEKLSCGTYQLQNGIFLNVESYKTQSRDLKEFESHRKYIDFQYIINGKEVISICERDSLYATKKYDCHKDIEFYQGKDGQDYVLAQGEGILLYPNNAHMPCVQFENRPLQVKKAVFKIPIHYFMDIRILVFDVDGTLTNGKIYMGNNGELAKEFDVKDGYGIKEMLPSIGMIPIIITARDSNIVKRRCEELGIKYFFQNVNDKWSKLKELLDKLSLSASNVGYVGDDLNDMNCMTSIIEAGGIVACPQDAVNAIKEIADYVCLNNAGNGAVRELIDFLAGR